MELFQPIKRTPTEKQQPQPQRRSAQAAIIDEYGRVMKRSASNDINEYGRVIKKSESESAMFNNHGGEWGVRKFFEER